MTVETLKKDFLLIEMIERLKTENIKFSITECYFDTIIFAEYPEIGNGSLRFAITATAKGRYALEGYYDNDKKTKPFIYRVISKRNMKLSTVISHIKHGSENLDEILDLLRQQWLNK